MIIETRNLKLISGDTDLLRSAIEGNEILAKRINAIVQDNWTEFGVDSLQYSLNQLTESEKEKNWWTYFPIHKYDNKLIGCGGYKGKPSNDGRVKSIIAHTLGKNNPSTSVLQKCGFEKVEELNDPDEGTIWKWELKRI